MSNLIDYHVAPETLDAIRKSKNNNPKKKLFRFIFSLTGILAILAGTFFYVSSTQKAEAAIEFGLGNDYEEIIKMNEEVSNNVPLSIDSITTLNIKGDKRVVALMIFFEKYKSPMASLSVAKAFIDSADANKFGDKWYLLPAISGIESGFGKAIPRNGKAISYNAWGWSGGSKYGRWSYFDSWEDAAVKVSKGLAKGYAATGFDPDKIMKAYCPPCARPESNKVWSRTVNKYIDEMKGILSTL